MSKSLTFYHFALRDILIFVMTILVWHYAAAFSQGSGALADFAGIAVGAMVALCSHLSHEWGHIIGGLAGRSAMQPGTSLKSLSLFVYSSKSNSKKQFLLMSACGFLATGAMVLLSFFVLPDDYLASHVARGYSLIQVALAVVLEFPLVVWALFGKGLPPVDKVSY
jgi:hypothetical protein